MVHFAAMGNSRLDCTYSSHMYNKNNFLLAFFLKISYASVLLETAHFIFGGGEGTQRDRERQTERDREGQRETDRDREGQRESERGGAREKTQVMERERSMRMNEMQPLACHISIHYS